MTGLKGTELGIGEVGHTDVSDTDLVAGGSLLTVILSDERLETSDNVNSDSSS